MGHQQRALIIQFCKKNRTKRKTEGGRGREKAHKKNAKTLSSSVVWEGGGGTGGWMVHIMFYVHMESSLEKPGENENELCFSSFSFSFFFFFLFLSSFYLVLLLFYSSLFFVFPFTYRELFRRFAFAQVRVKTLPLYARCRRIAPLPVPVPAAAPVPVLVCQATPCGPFDVYVFVGT